MPDIGALLRPRTVALIGASAEADTLRGRILVVMRAHPFAGQLYAVSRGHDEVAGLKAYRSVADLPQPPDLAVIIIPAQYVAGELERCAKAGARAAVILSSGFAEASGDRGLAMQGEIRSIARRYDMAVLGPNSEGFANTAAALCPTFSPVMEASERPLLPAQSRGQLAVIAQSGGIGFSFFDHGRAKELSFRYIVTTGNEACLGTFDIADYLLEEGKTDVLLLMLEDVKSAAIFQSVAEKALRAGKPIILNKIGRSDAGVRAAASHTAALAGSYAAYRAMFERFGLIEGGDIGEMVDIAAGFAAWRSKLPAGKRVAICTGSGGGGGWMADACVAAGLEVPELDGQTRAAIDVHLPSYGTSQNPVDATAQAIHKIGYAGLAELLVASPMIDAVIVVMTARSPKNLERQSQRLAALAVATQKPILLWSYTLPAPRSIGILSEAGYPLYSSVPNCARTLRLMADYRTLRERFLKPIEVKRPFEPDRAGASRELAAGARVLCEWEARPILACYGIGTNPLGMLVSSAEGAVEAARAMAGPVALKVQSPDILHKSEAGAVALSLSTPEAVRAGYHGVLAGAHRHVPGAHILGVLVQPMSQPGRELILGVKRDQTFGPLLMVGFGGVNVEVLSDVVLSPLPLGAREGLAMLERLKGVRLLGAGRGTPAADIDALVEVMVRLAALAGDHPEHIAEIDLNPVIVHAQGHGVSVVDALIVKPSMSVRPEAPPSQ
jgi:acyl-CoA synthetase (NDP forming)